MCSIRRQGNICVLLDEIKATFLFYETKHGELFCSIRRNKSNYSVLLEATRPTILFYWTKQTPTIAFYHFCVLNPTTTMGLEPILTVIIFLAAEWITGIVSISTGSFAKVNACFDPAGTTAIALSLTHFHRSIRIFCASKCLQDEGCKSFSVHPSTRTCYINDVVLLDTECTDSYLHFNSDKVRGSTYFFIYFECDCRLVYMCPS